MRILLAILIFIILLNCLKKHNKIQEGLEKTEDEITLEEKCSSFPKEEEHICDNECNSEKYKLKEDELLGTDDNKPETFKKMIIEKIKEIINKINNCDLCMYCKLLKNKIDADAATNEDP
jgi:hypothetical protein